VKYSRLGWRSTFKLNILYIYIYIIYIYVYIYISFLALTLIRCVSIVPCIVLLHRTFNVIYYYKQCFRLHFPVQRMLVLAEEYAANEHFSYQQIFLTRTDMLYACMRHNTPVSGRLGFQRKWNEATLGRLALPEGASVCLFFAEDWSFSPDWGFSSWQVFPLTEGFPCFLLIFKANDRV
jgi:hypothetical protein